MDIALFIKICDYIFYSLIGLSSAALFYKVVYFCFAFTKPKKFKDAKDNHRYAVLIPARNESKVIGNLLDSLNKQTYPRDKYDVYVIVEKEDDPTVEICKKQNAIPFVRRRLDLKGKGYALWEVIEYIKKEKNEKYEAYYIFDADNVLSPTYLEEMNKAYDAGYDMALGYRNSKNWNDGWIAASSGLTFTMLNTCQNKCRSKFGYNILVSGTGFYISDKIIEKAGGWTFYCLTEDVELSTYSVVNNVKSTYCELAEFYDEQPKTFKNSWNQRVRWVKGYMQVQKKYKKDLIKKGLTDKGNRWPKIEFVTSIFALGLMVATIIVYSLLMFAGAIYGGVVHDGLWLTCLLKGLLIVFITYCFLALYTFGMIMAERKMINIKKRKATSAVLMGPFFLALYLPIFIQAACKKEVKWVAIQRSDSANFNIEQLQKNKKNK